MNPLMENQEGNLTMVEESKFFEVKCNGYIPGKDFKTKALALKKLMGRSLSKAWIINCQSFKIVSPENQNWFVENCFKEFLKVNHPKIGVITSKDMLGKRTISNMTSKLKKTIPDLEIRIFEDMQMMEHWLNRTHLTTETTH